jgi:hypothetical protein
LAELCQVHLLYYLIQNNNKWIFASQVFATKHTWLITLSYSKLHYLSYPMHFVTFPRFQDRHQGNVWSQNIRPPNDQKSLYLLQFFLHGSPGWMVLQLMLSLLTFSSLLLVLVKLGQILRWGIHAGHINSVF